jgi:L-2,4-diaminobutyrate decarboxylase
MASPLPDILTEIEHDTSIDAGTRFVRLVADYFAATRTGDGPVTTALTPEAIAARFDEPLPARGRPLADVVARLAADVLPDVNRLYHPMYVGHQVSAPLPAAVWTEALTAALNQSTAVWEMSPVATIVEHQVIAWLADLTGFGPRTGGTMTSGGTEATFAALLAARARLLPDAWTDGVGDDPPVVLCGEHAHYAVARAVGEMGLGTRNLLVVPSADWRMDVGALARMVGETLAAGRRILAVVATAGSTATGSFDDLEAIADVCDAHGIWLHVDGAHGASALLAPAHRDRVRGIARARSLAWDPHKMLLLPLAAGVVLVRDGADLDRAFAQKAPYLFHAPVDDGEGPPRVWDQGLRSFQCSRRADALKLWVAFQRYGADGLGALYAHLCAVTTRLHARLAEREEFEVLHAPESNILCFRWRATDAASADVQDALNLAIRERYNRSGAGWISTTVLGGRRVLRVTIMNPRTADSHLAAVVDGLARVGRAEAARHGAGHASGRRSSPAGGTGVAP